MESEESLRLENLRPVRRLAVSARLTTSGPVKQLGLLDVCQGCRQLPETSARAKQQYIMVRVAMKPRFEPRQLELWLSESEADLCNNNNSSGGGGGGGVEYHRDGRGLKRLMGQGKFRVLDVLAEQVVVLRQPARYVTLSYVWGRNAVPCKLQNSNRPNVSIDQAWPVDLAKCPQTIRDAALLVRQIAERYIWIDSLCIDQSDDIHTLAVIAEMGGFYSSGHFNIIAADGDSANAGLQRLSALSPAESMMRFRQHGQPISLLPRRDSLKVLLRQTAWNHRAWTYQERLLSRRNVIFTPGEVVFTAPRVLCREAYSLETLWDRSKPSRTKTRKLPSIQDIFGNPVNVSGTGNSLFEHYTREVMTYSSRSLTFAGDRLNAFSGVLHKLLDNHAPRDKTATLSGLWPLDQDFTTSLLWFPEVQQGSVARIPHDASNTRALPSWSWVGWSGPIKFPDSCRIRLEPVFMDKNNFRIECENPEFNWPFDPEPCLTVKDGIVLHVWTHVMRGELKFLTTRDNGLGKSWNIDQAMLALPSGHWSKTIHFWDYGHVISGKEDKLHDFVLISDHSVTEFRRVNFWIMMVKRCNDGQSFERVALSEEGHFEIAIPAEKALYDELTGPESSVHVRII